MNHTICCRFVIREKPHVNYLAELKIVFKAKNTLKTFTFVLETSKALV